jgi:hypothetical protein
MEQIKENILFDDNSDIELRHNEADSILNDPPAWIVRVGSYMVYGLVLLIIAIAAIIKYPDTLVTEVEIINDKQANMILPYSNISKQVKQHTTVNIEIDNYPARDFGFLSAEIYNMEYSAITQSYSIGLLLLQNAESINNKKIIIDANTKGKATIILNNKSLLQRVFEILLK